MRAAGEAPPHNRLAYQAGGWSLAQSNLSRGSFRSRHWRGTAGTVQCSSPFPETPIYVPMRHTLMDCFKLESSKPHTVCVSPLLCACHAQSVCEPTACEGEGASECVACQFISHTTH